MTQPRSVKTFANYDCNFPMVEPQNGPQAFILAAVARVSGPKQGVEKR